jgi:hypothetical protein
MSLANQRETLTEALNAVIAPVLGEAGFRSELDREIAGAFAFGFVYADGRSADLSQAEVHGLSVHVLHAVIGYDEPSAARFASDLIHAAADPEFHDTLHAVIHRGIDGHAAWQRNRIDVATANLKDILDYMRDRSLQ